MSTDNHKKRQQKALKKLETGLDHLAMSQYTDFTAIP